jgi:hypothetical protein
MACRDWVQSSATLTWPWHARGTDFRINPRSPPHWRLRHTTDAESCCSLFILLDFYYYFFISLYLLLSIFLYFSLLVSSLLFIGKVTITGKHPTGEAGDSTPRVVGFRQTLITTSRAGKSYSLGKYFLTPLFFSFAIAHHCSVHICPTAHKVHCTAQPCYLQVGSIRVFASHAWRLRGPTRPIAVLGRGELTPH